MVWGNGLLGAALHSTSAFPDHVLLFPANSPEPLQQLLATLFKSLSYLTLIFPLAKPYIASASLMSIFDLYFPQLWLKLANIWDYETSGDGLSFLIL